MSFCTNIQEIAKMRGLVKGEPCRSVGYEDRPYGRTNEPVYRERVMGPASTTTININLGDILEKGIEGDITININL